MSYGYDRVPSEAQALRNRAVERFKRACTELRDESVGKDIKFTKKPTVVDDLPANKEGTAKMSDFDTAIAEQRFAQKMYPEEKSVGAALAKWYATPQGKAVSQSFSADIHRRQQLKAAGKYESAGIADHTAYAGAVQGGYGVSSNVGNDFTGGSAARFDGTNVPSAVAASKSHPNLVTKANIDKLMKDFDLNFDQAATVLARGGK